MEPLKISKLNTAAQIVLAALVLGLAGFGIADRTAVQVMSWIVAATTVVSLAAYIHQWSQRVARAGGKG